MIDECDEEGDQIRAQLAALRAGPKHELRKRRALEYRCARCGQTILSVMNTTPHRVIAGRREAEDSGLEQEAAAFYATRPSVKERARFWIERGSQGRVRVSHDVGVFLRIPHDFEVTAAENELISMMCRCSRWSFTAASIGADLRNGVKKRSWPLA